MLRDHLMVIGVNEIGIGDNKREGSHPYFDIPHPVSPVDSVRELLKTKRLWLDAVDGKEIVLHEGIPGEVTQIETLVVTDPADQVPLSTRTLQHIVVSRRGRPSLFIGPDDYSRTTLLPASAFGVRRNK